MTALDQATTFRLLLGSRTLSLLLKNSDPASRTIMPQTTMLLKMMTNLQQSTPTLLKHRQPQLRPLIGGNQTILKGKVPQNRYPQTRISKPGKCQQLKEILKC